MKKNAVIYILLLSCLVLCACSGNLPPKMTRIAVASESRPPSKAAVSVSDTDIEGCWYGWWEISDLSGDWANVSGRRSDCCAEISSDNRLRIWDALFPEDYPLAELELDRSGSQLRCIGGYFLDVPTDGAAWNTSLSIDADGKLIVITGTYVSVNYEGDFYNRIVLRPWGAEWSCDEYELPDAYHSWYIPLIEQGCEMPDELPNQYDNDSDK